MLVLEAAKLHAVKVLAHSIDPFPFGALGDVVREDGELVQNVRGDLGVDADSASLLRFDRGASLLWTFAMYTRILDFQLKIILDFFVGFFAHLVDIFL